MRCPNCGAELKNNLKLCYTTSKTLFKLTLKRDEIQKKFNKVKYGNPVLCCGGCEKELFKYDKKVEEKVKAILKGEI